MKYGFIKAAAGTPEIRVADTSFNAENIIRIVRNAGEAGAKLLVLPELCVTGYTCGDLFFQRTLIRGAVDALHVIAQSSVNLDTLIFAGAPLKISGALYNCAVAIQYGKIIAVIPKIHLRDSGGYCESRYFASGAGISTEIEIWGSPVPFGAEVLLRCAEIPELCVAVEVGGDLCVPIPPSSRHAVAGASVIVNLSAFAEAGDSRLAALVSDQSKRLTCAYICAGAGTGESTTDFVFTGQDIIVENGIILAQREMQSGIVSSEIDVFKLDFERRRMAGAFGRLSHNAADYREIRFSLPVANTVLTRGISQTPFYPANADDLGAFCEKIIRMQALGLRQRLLAAGSRHPVIGVSGGLDSTLAILITAVATDSLELDRENIIAVTMPCFGTTKKTKSSAVLLSELLGATLKIIDISESVKRHFTDIGHDINNTDTVFENAQARERIQVLMDIANSCGGIVVGTGDMSELALGWTTYGGDHLSMYGVNAGVPKTLVRELVSHYALSTDDIRLRDVLMTVLSTPVSPELLPSEDGVISQKTEDIVGPYELHDFFLYHAIRWGGAPEKVLYLAEQAFMDKYDGKTIRRYLEMFYRRFFAQQFKRSCMPDGPKILDFSLSPRGDWRMPSDAGASLWMESLFAD